MTAIAFDTLKFVRLLREKAKLSPEQADGFAAALAEALQGDRVTKADLRAELAKTKAELVRSVAGLIGFQTLALVGAVVALVKRCIEGFVGVSLRLKAIAWAFQRVYARMKRSLERCMPKKHFCAAGCAETAVTISTCRSSRRDLEVASGSGCLLPGFEGFV